MIISASRRTDIPNYYSGWFFNRIKEGYLYVRNPTNIHQISNIDLSPEVVDCIVFGRKTQHQCQEDLENVQKFANYNPDSPLLCSTVALGDKITDKKSKKFERKTVKFI